MEKVLRSLFPNIHILVPFKRGVPMPKQGDFIRDKATGKRGEILTVRREMATILFSDGEGVVVLPLWCISVEEG